MIRVSVKRPIGWNQLGRKELRQLKELILSDLLGGLRAMQESILQTPVYTGRTLANYRWSLAAPIEGARAPISRPALPGKTSELKLGSEPRRAVNAAQVEQEFREVIDDLKKNPLQDIYLVNNTPYFLDVEYGTYSTSEGAQTRTPPGGMVRRGETLLEVHILGLNRRSGGV